MGLFGTKITGGGLMDAIRCDEPSYLIWKWHPEGTVAGMNQKENSIRFGSSITVKDGSVAVFVCNQPNGVEQEYIVGPYNGLLETANLPLISQIVGAAYAGGTPFPAEVYFINLANLIQVKFGVPYFDVFDIRFPDLGVPTAVRGTISFRISDYREFIKLHRLEQFNLEDFQIQIRDMVVRYTKSVVSNAPGTHGIPVVQLEQRIDEISSLIENEISGALQSDFGVSLNRLDISSIEQDKTSTGYKKIQSITQNKVSMVVQAASNIVNNVSMQGIGAKKIKQTAKKEFGSSPFSAFGKIVSDTVGGKKQDNSTPPPLPLSGFYVVLDGEQAGPFDVGKLRQMLENGEITRDTLAWKEGMKEWKRAETVKDLKTLFGK